MPIPAAGTQVRALPNGSQEILTPEEELEFDPYEGPEDPVTGVLEIIKVPADYDFNSPEYILYLVDSVSVDPDTIEESSVTASEAEVEFSYVEYLRTKWVELYNKCHTPEGPQGGQFCSDNIDLSGLTGDMKQRAQKIANVINSVHDLPDTFPNVSVLESSDIGNSDGIYDSEKDTIYISPNREGKEITFVHEFGHHVSLGEEGNFTADQFLDKIDRISTLTKWKVAVETSPTTKGLRDRWHQTQDGYDGYLLDSRELFARSYAQWIAVRSGNKTLIDQLERNRSNNPNFQWQDDEFAPIAESFDEHFKVRKNTTS